MKQAAISVEAATATIGFPGVATVLVVAGNWVWR
jgi:hypothetical protein